LPVGEYEVEFKEVSGWNTPENETVTIAENQTTEITGEYTLTGSLQVSIEPEEAIDAGAKWRVDGGPWQSSDATETGLSVGAHTVSFKPISGWDEPGDETVVVEANKIMGVSGTYTVEEQPLLSCPMLETKAFEPFAEVSVYEPVMPSVVDENGVRLCASLAPLAIRLRSSEAIDPNTVWGVVTWREAVSETVTWLPLDDNDGWAIYEPETPWAEGEVVSFVAGAYSVSGQEIGPFTYEFMVSGDVYEGRAAVIESDSTTNDAEFVGIAYEISPDTVYFEPLTVQLPVPEGVDATALEPAYLFTENSDSRWMDGTHVEGWLEPGSVRAIETAHGNYVEFQVNHGGIVQLRRRVADVSPAGMSNSAISGDLFLFLALAGFLLFQKRRCFRSFEDRRV
ncbi:MAG: hypothetical protein U9Q79_11115, partial [Candidatus Hydrogenedentes bacterium]|nr:hypothetical protein [Candidatus Hydrogenedentota bacterium]